MAKVILIQVFLFLVYNGFAQKIHLGNDSSVIKYFSNTKVNPLAQENTSMGFISVAFKIIPGGYVRNIEKQFASDSLLFPTILRMIKSSSGKWIRTNDSTDQQILMNFYIQPIYGDSIKAWAEKSILENSKHGWKRHFIKSEIPVQENIRGCNLNCVK